MMERRIVGVERTECGEGKGGGRESVEESDGRMAKGEDGWRGVTLEALRD
ncbi:MAG: hypothetical protein GY820_36445 [Gammaproteobacteria bacterium]|nr:hypothetical protein [Gammaproteobacteria bacterium]